MRLILKGIAYLVIGLVLAVALGVLIGGPISVWHDQFHCTWGAAVLAYLEFAGGISALCALIVWAIHMVTGE